MSRTVLKTNALNISLVAIDDRPPSAIIRTLEVEDSTFKIIDQNDIRISDVDSDMARVQMRMSDLPQHGLLMVDGRPADVETWVNATYLSKMKFRLDNFSQFCSHPKPIAIGRAKNFVVGLWIFNLKYFFPCFLLLFFFQKMIKKSAAYSSGIEIMLRSALT